MKKTSVITATAAAAAMSLAMVGEAAAKKNEKCYGVVKAGQNDCQTATSSCQGTSKVDDQPDAWVYLPAGMCERLTGGSLKPKS